MKIDCTLRKTVGEGFIRVSDMADRRYETPNTAH